MLVWRTLFWAVLDLSPGLFWSIRSAEAQIPVIMRHRSTTSTTSTSTTTSPSTSTTLAAAPWAIFPDVTATGGQSGSPNNTMWCGRLTVRQPVVGATSLTAGFGGIANEDAGIAIYADSDSGAQVAAGSAPHTADGPLVLTGLPSFNLNPNTPYRFCVCNDSSQNFVAVFTLDVSRLVEAFSNIVATAGNPCTGDAVPPATTGELSTLNSPRFPVIVVE